MLAVASEAVMISACVWAISACLVPAVGLVEFVCMLDNPAISRKHVDSLSFRCSFLCLACKPNVNNKNSPLEHGCRHCRTWKATLLNTDTCV